MSHGHERRIEAGAGNPVGRPGRRRDVAGIVVAVVIVAAARDVRAQIRIPDPVGLVNDFADVIDPAAESAIARTAEEVRRRSGGEIVVVTLPSLLGMSRNDLAHAIGERWGVGKSGCPNDPARQTGTLVLVVPKEVSPDGRGHVEIALAFGANAFITASEAGRIRDALMIPAFRRGDYGGGIEAGVNAIAAEYAERFGIELTGVVPPAPVGEPEPGLPWSTLLALGFVLAIVLVALLAARGGGGPPGRATAEPGTWGQGRGPIVVPPFPTGGGRRGGGFGGGFGGFGRGGGFGGGGAGGSW